MRALTKRLHRLTKASQDATDELAYVVEENVLAHRDIRLHNAQASQAQRFEGLSEKLSRIALKSTVAGAAMTPVTQMLAAIALSAVISVALVQSATSGTSVGGFVAFVTAMLMIVAPIRQLSEVSSPITKGLAALERALHLLDNAADEMDGNYSPDLARGEIQFSDVNVRYDLKKPWAVKDFTLNIRPGETLALVGTSGSGKTTIANLIPRYVDLSGGTLLIDGVDIKSWKLQCLRSQIAVVSQHVMMVNDTIAANVSLGSVPDRQRIEVCLGMANLQEFVAALENGMDTLVGHNAMELSGGQRQRLAIARALYKDAPILILDEATSALDADSERLVQESLAKLMKNRTTLVIAHRLSTIRNANRIVVMASGEIVESGTHDELLHHNGLYARLHQAGQSSRASSQPTPAKQDEHQAST
jgi:subfamily B ATP-binding cassette protein MsbA